MSSPRPTATVLKLVSNFDIAGQSYTTTVKALDKNGNKTSLEYEGMTGTPYGSFFYSSGALTGTQKTFAGIKGQAYTSVPCSTTPRASRSPRNIRLYKQTVLDADVFRRQLRFRALVRHAHARARAGRERLRFICHPK